MASCTLQKTNHDRPLTGDGFHLEPAANRWQDDGTGTVRSRFERIAMSTPLDHNDPLEPGLSFGSGRPSTREALGQARQQVEHGGIGRAHRVYAGVLRSHGA